MHTIKRAFFGAVGVAIGVMLFGMQGTGTLAADYDTANPVYTFPSTGYEATQPIYTFPSTGYDIANPVYTFPATRPVLSSSIV